MCSSNNIPTRKMSLSPPSNELPIISSNNTKLQKNSSFPGNVQYVQQERPQFSSYPQTQNLPWDFFNSSRNNFPQDMPPNQGYLSYYHHLHHSLPEYPSPLVGGYVAMNQHPLNDTQPILLHIPNRPPGFQALPILNKENNGIITNDINSQEKNYLQKITMNNSNLHTDKDSKSNLMRLPTQSIFNDFSRTSSREREPEPIIESPRMRSIHPEKNEMWHNSTVSGNSNEFYNEQLITSNLEMGGKPTKYFESNNELNDIQNTKDDSKPFCHQPYSRFVNSTEESIRKENELFYKKYNISVPTAETNGPVLKKSNILPLLNSKDDSAEENVSVPPPESNQDLSKNSQTPKKGNKTFMFLNPLLAGNMSDYGETNKRKPQNQYIFTDDESDFEQLENPVFIVKISNLFSNKQSAQSNDRKPIIRVLHSVRSRRRSIDNGDDDSDDDDDDDYDDDDDSDYILSPKKMSKRLQRILQASAGMNSRLRSARPLNLSPELLAPLPSSSSPLQSSGQSSPQSTSSSPSPPQSSPPPPLTKPGRKNSIKSLKPKSVPSYNIQQGVVKRPRGRPRKYPKQNDVKSGVPSISNKPVSSTFNSIPVQKNNTTGQKKIVEVPLPATPVPVMKKTKKSVTSSPVKSTKKNQEKKNNDTPIGNKNGLVDDINNAQQFAKYDVKSRTNNHIENEVNNRKRLKKICFDASDDSEKIKSNAIKEYHNMNYNADKNEFTGYNNENDSFIRRSKALSAEGIVLDRTGNEITNKDKIENQKEIQEENKSESEKEKEKENEKEEQTENKNENKNKNQNESKNENQNENKNENENENAKQNKIENESDKANQVQIQTQTQNQNQNQNQNPYPNQELNQYQSQELDQYQNQKLDQNESKNGQELALIEDNRSLDDIQLISKNSGPLLADLQLVVPELNVRPQKLTKNQVDNFQHINGNVVKYSDKYVNSDETQIELRQNVPEMIQLPGIPVIPPGFVPMMMSPQGLLVPMQYIPIEKENKTIPVFKPVWHGGLFPENKEAKDTPNVNENGQQLKIENNKNVKSFNEVETETELVKKRHLKLTSIDKLAAMRLCLISKQAYSEYEVTGIVTVNEISKDIEYQPCLDHYKELVKLENKEILKRYKKLRKKYVKMLKKVEKSSSSELSKDIKEIRDYQLIREKLFQDYNEKEIYNQYLDRVLENSSLVCLDYTTRLVKLKKYLETKQEILKKDEKNICHLNAKKANKIWKRYLKQVSTDKIGISKKVDVKSELGSLVVSEEDVEKEGDFHHEKKLKENNDDKGEKYVEHIEKSDDNKQYEEDMSQIISEIEFEDLTKNRSKIYENFVLNNSKSKIGEDQSEIIESIEFFKVKSILSDLYEFTKNGVNSSKDNENNNINVPKSVLRLQQEKDVYNSYGLRDENNDASSSGWRNNRLLKELQIDGGIGVGVKENLTRTERRSESGFLGDHNSSWVKKYGGNKDVNISSYLDPKVKDVDRVRMLNLNEDDITLNFTRVYGMPNGLESEEIEHDLKIMREGTDLKN